MKKINDFLIFSLCFLILAGCARSAPVGQPESAALSASASASAAPPASTALPSTAEPAAVYDLDLTQCSATVIYAEVFHMMNEPDDYVGKRIRMKGICATYAYPDHTVYGCIIADATACCKQGVEFVLADRYRLEDYPVPGSEIVVSGVFHLYQAGEFTFCNLIDCELESDPALSK